MSDETADFQQEMAAMLGSASAPVARPGAKGLLNRPRTPAPTAEQTAAPAPSAPTAPARVSRPTFVPPPAPKPTPPFKLNAYVDKDLRDQFVSAIRQTSAITGVSTVSEAVSEAMKGYLKLLEDEYNGGEPFTPYTGSMPAGRQASL